VEKALHFAAYDHEITNHLRILLYEEFGLLDHSAFPMATFFQKVHGTKLNHYMKFIGVNAVEMERLMTMIQSMGRSQLITTGAFIKGCMKVRGEARSLDMQHLLLAMQFMQKNQAEIKKNQASMQKNQMDIITRMSSNRAPLNDN